MKNVLKTFAVVAVCLAALTGTSYAGTAKWKSGKNTHAKHMHTNPAPAKTVK